MTTFLLIFSFVIAVVHSIRIHSTKYQIASIYVPKINNEKLTNDCKQHTLDIESISFMHLNELNVHTTERKIDRYSFEKQNYTIFDLQKSIHFSPNVLLNGIKIEIHLNSDHYFCSPAYLVLPIVNNDVTLKCIMNKWDFITDTMSYSCQSSALIPSSQSPSTTMFYSMDFEYKQAIKEFNDQKRRLFTNESNVLHSNNHQNNEEKNNYFGIDPLHFWIIIGSVFLCILITFCVIIVICTKHRKGKIMKNENMDTSKQHTSKYSPVSTEDNLEKQNIIEMTDMTTQITKCDSTESSSFGQSNEGDETTKSLKIKVTQPENIKESKSVSFLFGNIKSRKQRVNTESFDTDSALCTPQRSLDLQSNRSGYSVDDEDDDKDMGNLVLSPQMLSQLSSNPHMKILPDDDEEEDENEQNKENKNNEFYKRCFSLNALDDYDCIRRHSGDIDYDKMDNLYKNSWGTSLPLNALGSNDNEDGIGELTKSHTFFYRAPSISTKFKRKKRRFKHQIREDSMSQQDMLDEVISQMITDSEIEISDNVHSQPPMSTIIKSC